MTRSLEKLNRHGLIAGAKKGGLQIEGNGGPKGRSLFLQGVLVGASNPKSLLFFPAFFPTATTTSSFTSPEVSPSAPGSSCARAA